MGTYRIENWPSAPATMAPELKKEFAAHAGHGRVGNELLSETDRVRVWAIGLKPGQRLGFHTHVLDYFWTSVTGGHGRSHFSDGQVSDTVYKPGDIKQITFKEGRPREDWRHRAVVYDCGVSREPNAQLELRSHTRAAPEV
jgi:beta-alanine degradation protein BauB